MTCVFDENLPPKLARALNELEGKDGVKVVHLKDFFPPSTKDIDWINKLSKIEECFIITKDRKIKRNPHEYLVWKETGLPIVFMQKSWKDLKFWDLTWKFIKRWEEIKICISQNRSLLLPISVQ